ncbi:unnamed protein product [Effrenium voratum]|nr:unnamed protein product [Effrenium voratum]
MGVPTSATERWLHWTAKTQEPVDAEEFPKTFSLEGPIPYWRVGSSEVKSAYMGVSGSLLIMGPKWNVVHDFLDLSHLVSSVMGSMVCLSGGRGGGKDIVMRLFLADPSSAQQWAEQLTAGSFKQVTSTYIDQLKELILKNQKAARRQLWAARFGRLMESLCRDADAERRLPQVQTPTSTTLEGAEHSFVGRYYMKSSRREGTGKIFIHGDTLIFQTPTGEKSVSRIGVPLTGCTATTASFMVSARGPEGLALVRLWLKDAEEAEQMAAAIGTTGKASSDLIQRKTLSGASTMRRQMGRAAYGLCAAVAQVPQSLRRKLVPECNCFARKKKTRTVATSNNFRLDGRCCILPAKTTEVRACHATLRGDALWTGQKAGASDQVLSVINASAVATADMVAIRTRNGDLHRLFPDDHAGSASQWCQAIQAAGKMSKDLGKWEANLRSAFYKDTAKEKVQKLARWRRFRNLGQRLVSGASKLTGWLSWEHQLTGMEVLMAWQALSVIQADAVAPTTKAFPSRTAKFFRRADANKAMERTLEIRGDVMFVINQDKYEKPVLLEGAEVFANGAIVSIWKDNEMQARIFLETEEDAERWGKELERAAVCVEEAKTAQEEDDTPKSMCSQPSITPSTSSGFLRAVAPPKLPDEESTKPLRSSSRAGPGASTRKKPRPRPCRRCPRPRPAHEWKRGSEPNSPETYLAPVKLARPE